MNIRELARACGVSHTTASLALRNDPRISRPVRERVQEVARSNGYRPNPELSHVLAGVARGAGGQIAAPLALISQWPKPEAWKGQPILAQFFEGLSKRAAELAYKLEEFWLGGPGMTESRLVNVLSARGITGVVIFSYPRAPWRSSLNLNAFAGVVVGRALLSPRLPAVDQDHFQGFMLAIHELTRRGYVRIGMLLIMDDSQVEARTSHQWEAGFLFYNQGLAARSRVPMLAAHPREKDRVKKWISRYKPDAVIGADSGTLELLRDCGMDVPAQIGYVALAHRRENTAYAGIDILGEVVGATAIDILDAQLRDHRRGPPHVATTVLTEGVWREGGSVRTLRDSPR